MQCHTVNNVEEAVELALRFKNEGKYDWFRGQLQADWEPKSSLERAIENGENQEQLEKRLMRFLAWAKTEPSLSYLAESENCDQLFAVLQHYGFPTSYIDFSTDPGIAGFFASDYKKEPTDGTQSVIFCLNTADLRSFYDESITPYYKQKSTPLHVELVSVNVDNLWRLQAQSGHFVFTNHTWYRFYDMDRIVFPWTGYPSFPPKNRIYPEHRSSLEQLLDNYFEDERRHTSYIAFEQEQLRRNQNGDSSFHFMRINSDGYNPDVLEAPTAGLPSWSAESLKPWLELNGETFHEVVGLRHTIALRQGSNVPALGRQLEYGISAAIRQDGSLRRRTVHWELQGLPTLANRDTLEKQLRDVWNGMRRLPYSDEDIAIACGNLLELSLQPNINSLFGGDVLNAFQAWRPDAMEVEFGSGEDSGSRGYCSEALLNRTISNDWIQTLPAGVSVESPSMALSVCYTPKYMLDFTAFATLFGRELIPSQLVRERPLVHFNPARIGIFGLP